MVSNMGVTRFHFLGVIPASTRRKKRHPKGFGVSFRSAPVDIPYGPSKGGRTIYFNDPNGVNIQLMETHSRPGDVPLPAGVKGASA